MTDSLPGDHQHGSTVSPSVVPEPIEPVETANAGISTPRSSQRLSVPELDKLWRASPERDLARRARINWLISSLSILIAGGVVDVITVTSINGGVFPVNVSPSIATIVIAAIVAGLIAKDYSNRSWRFRDAREEFFRNQDAFIRTRLIQEIAEDESDNLSLGNLFELNQNSVDEYHEITREQSANAFKNSQIASAVGLFLLAVGIGLAFVPAPFESRIASVGVAALGSILSSYVSRTFLESHKISVQQLNEFFKQPVIGNYLLIAERLSGQLQPTSRDEAITLIIQQAMKAAGEISRREISQRPDSKDGVDTPGS